MGFEESVIELVEVSFLTYLKKFNSYSIVSSFSNFEKYSNYLLNTITCFFNDHVSVDIRYVKMSIHPFQTL